MDIKFQLQDCWEIESNWPPRKQNKKDETVGWSENTHIIFFPSDWQDALKCHPEANKLKSSRQITILKPKTRYKET